MTILCRELSYVPPLKKKTQVYKVRPKELAMNLSLMEKQFFLKNFIILCEILSSNDLSCLSGCLGFFQDFSLFGNGRGDPEQYSFSALPLGRGELGTKWYQVGEDGVLTATGCAFFTWVLSCPLMPFLHVIHAYWASFGYQVVTSNLGSYTCPILWGICFSWGVLEGLFH